MPIKSRNTRVPRRNLKRITTAEQAKLAKMSKAQMRVRQKAYRRKAQFAAKRRPFVEIKSRSHYDLWISVGGSTTFPNVDTITNPMVLQNMTNDDVDRTPKRAHLFPIWSYMNPVQGVTENDMVGQTLTAKYLKAKVNFQFPSVLQTNNPTYYLIHGWVKVPLNLTQYTTPTRTGITRSNLIQHILNHITRDFDENNKEEFLQFKKAERKDYIVLGYKKVRPNQNQLQVQPAPSLDGTSTVALGRLNVLNLSFSWPCNNRKIRYEKGTDSTMTGSAPFFYDNKGYIPFLLYYCPTAGEGLGPGNGESKSPSIAYNNKFWFSDS